MQAKWIKIDIYQDSMFARGPLQRLSILKCTARQADRSNKRKTKRPWECKLFIILEKTHLSYDITPIKIKNPIYILVRYVVIREQTSQTIMLGTKLPWPLKSKIVVYRTQFASCRICRSQRYRHITSVFAYIERACLIGIHNYSSTMNYLLT